MNIHSPCEQVKTALGVAAAITAATNNGTGIDCLGFENAKVVLYSAPSGSGTTSDVKVQDSADNSTFADVTSAAFTQVTTAGGAKIYVGEIKLAKRARYIRIVHTGAGGSAAGFVVATVELYSARRKPVTQTNAAVFSV
ncbi:MAG: hypothetical protein JO053_01445 [Acidobacteria bacterium]|nr:hypothetical protein [Acidobacteriota bacterium]